MARAEDGVHRIEGEDPDLAPLDGGPQSQQALRRRSSDLSRVGSPMLGGLSYGSARSGSISRVRAAVGPCITDYRMPCHRVRSESLLGAA